MTSFLYGLAVWDNIRWITFLWTTLAVLFVTQTVSSERACEYSHIITMQRACKTQNEALMEAELSQNDKSVCKSLHNFWFCVARNVPQCFYNVSVNNEHLTHSPHYCRMSQSEFLQLQTIIRAGLKDTTVSLPTSVSGDDEYHIVTSSDNKQGVDGGHSNHKGTNSAPSSLCITWTTLALSVLTCLLPDYNVFAWRGY